MQECAIRRVVCRVSRPDLLDSKMRCGMWNVAPGSSAPTGDTPNILLLTNSGGQTYGTYDTITFLNSK